MKTTNSIAKMIKKLNRFIFRNIIECLRVILVTIIRQRILTQSLRQVLDNTFDISFLSLLKNDDHSTRLIELYIFRRLRLDSRY